MKSFCISHVKDVDGLSSAALTLAARGGRFRLTDYDQLFDEMDAIPADVDELVLCDLGTDSTRFEGLKGRLEELSRRMAVTYIDHHFLTPEMKKVLRASGIRLIHSVGECSSMLTYGAFQEQLPVESKYLALYGAVTDYMDGSPRGRRLMERLDRQYVLLESTMLSHAVGLNGRDYAYLERVVEELSKMKAPHSIEDVPRAAVEQAENVRLLALEVGKKGTRLGDLAYMETTESATGNVSKLLLGAFDVQVGVSYKQGQPGRVEASFRSTSECKLHLGQVIGGIAAAHGGSGGGHAKAAGCTVPRGEIMKVIEELALLLARPPRRRSR